MAEAHALALETPLSQGRLSAASLGAKGNGWQPKPGLSAGPAAALPGLSFLLALCSLGLGRLE